MAKQNVSNAIIKRFTANAKKWKRNECSTMVLNETWDDGPLHKTTVKMCGFVSKGVGPAVASAVFSGLWPVESPSSLNNHARAVLGYASLSAFTCFDSSLAVAATNGNEQCKSGWSFACYNPSTTPTIVDPQRPPYPAAPADPSPPPSPESCSRQCLKWTAAVKSYMPNLNAPACAEPLSYFNGVFVPELQAVLGSALGAAFGADVKGWAVQTCQNVIADYRQFRFSVNRVTFEVCGSVSAGVGPALAKALASPDSWAGPTPLDTHVRALTGYAAYPSGGCLNSTFAASSPNDTAQCAAAWSNRCAAPTLPPDVPDTPRALPPPATAPPPSPQSCSRQCLKWTAAVKTIMPDMNAPACEKPLAYFNGVLVPELQGVLGSALGAAFGADVKGWAVQTCRHNVADYFQLRFSVQSVTFEVCGAVSPGVGPALAKALASPSAWTGPTPLSTHARAITGYSSLSSTTCLNATFAASSPSATSIQCAAAWSNPCDAPALPPAAVAPPRAFPSPATGSPPPAACTQACIKLVAAVKSIEPELGAPACTKPLGYFANTFVPDLQLGMGSQIGSRFGTDAKRWAVTECEHMVEDYFDLGFSRQVATFKVCGPVSAGVGPALAKALASPETWVGETPFDAHVRGMTGFYFLSSATCLNATLALTGNNRDAACSGGWTSPCGAA
ncbi:hypothetical protein HYH03_011387 [Edaphochlamys debaryana]|uniref:Uncharacterized protein n=1 Tax=Edaphochlamys debaryana TaxID=47281 RepID=A0A835XTZ1_9CHLO|nr:hypothetical protein HYH03_011387 [Edaphochlamys debaryana]|eukprot:KAG2490081.1 hypothetical protein HYH03_011387 [Edaphochlamys debaryana]